MPYRNHRVYISFDYDHDLDLKNLLAGQAKNPDSPFEITDFSLKEAAPQADWKERATRRIRQVDTVAIVLGTYTHNASGVKAEVAIAKGESVRLFQIKRQGTNPSRVENGGVVYDWTWDNLKQQLPRKWVP